MWFWRISTEYPWNGDIKIAVKKSGVKNANLLVRIPGWVRNQVVPSDLYKYSDAEKPAYTVTVNGKAVEADLDANKVISLSRTSRRAM